MVPPDARARPEGGGWRPCCGAGVLAFIVGVSVGAGAGDGGDGAADEARRGRERGSGRGAAGRAPPGRPPDLRQRVGQVTISSFPGTAAPDYIRRRLRARETAGVILFGANGGDRAQWRRLTRSLQGAGAAGHW